MRLTKFSKKLLAYVCATALTVTSFAVPVWADKESGTVTADPLVLDGGEEGVSTMIKHFDAPTERNKPTDKYKYLGWCSFLDQVPDNLTPATGNYRYLVMTYTGDITQLRFEFTRAGVAGDGSDDEKQGPFWFNPDGQTHYFVTADGSDIPLIGDNTTIVIDLAESVNPDAIDETGKGVEIDWFNSGIHMHCDEMVKHGDGAGFDITDAYLTQELPVPPVESTTEEAVTDEPTTAEPVTDEPTTAEPVTDEPTTAEPVTDEPTTAEPVTDEPTTAEPATEAPTEIVTEPETEPETLPDPIVLDGDDKGESGLIGVSVLPADENDNGWHYGGWTWLKNATAEYKYMVLTYVGSLAQARFDIEGDKLYWFDPWQTDKFADLNGNDIDTSYSAEERTIYIDLEKSGAELGWGPGMHLHIDNLATNGGLTFTDAYVTKTKPDVSTVTIDGKQTIVANGSTVTVPADVVGYYTDGKLYAPGTEFTVTDDIEFSSVNFAISNSASIKFAIPAALRFKAAIQAPADVIADVVESEGMLIAPDNYYSEAGSLDLNSTYKKMNIVNSGWYNNKVGTYCASIAGIKEANYARDFVARAYATVTYADGTTATVYSNVSSARSVSGVAALLKASDAYAGYNDDQKSIIDAFVL
jgi:hypothetical protein